MRRIHLDVGDGLPLCGSLVNGPTLSSERIGGTICRNCQRDLERHWKPILARAEAGNNASDPITSDPS